MTNQYIPCVWSYNSKEMCRLNADCTWTVDWSVVLDASDLRPGYNCDHHVMQTVGLAKLLLAAKDNFRETSLMESQVIAEDAGRSRS